MDRYLPVGLGGVTTLAASIVDINWGVLAGGITLLGTAGGSVYWHFAKQRSAAYREAEAAKLEVYRNSEAAKLEVLKAEALARIEIRREQDRANEGSLSAQLEAMTGQLTSIQQSLEDAREANAALKIRIEDANKKLHQVNNDQQARELQHVAEKMELEQKYRDLRANLDAAHAENLALLSRVGAKVEDTKAQADRNSALIRELAPPVESESP